MEGRSGRVFSVVLAVVMDRDGHGIRKIATQ